MTNKELKKKIEGIVLPLTIHSDPNSFNTEKVEPLLSLFEKEKKEYALGVLPEEKDSPLAGYEKMIPRHAYTKGEFDGFNLAIKQVKENIND